MDAKPIKPVKTVESDRDSSLDRLLAESLEARAAAADALCIDAGTLAAWADNALSREEREAVEAHAADCARCQLMLAAMIRTTPTPVTTKPAWRRVRLAWLIPLGAAAAATVLWIVVPGRLTSRSGPAAASSTVADATTPAAPAGDLPGALRPDLQSQARRAPAPGASAEITAPAAPASKRADAKSGQPAAASRPADHLDRLTGQGSSSSDASALSGAGRADNAARIASPERGAATTASPAPPTQPAPTAAPPSPAPAATPQAFALARAIRPGAVIVSSNPATRWRTVPGGGVERSTDGGSTWQAQVTGVAVTLTAGASPSPAVCWLVGPDGTVLLSTDGRSWRRLPFPEATPLISVHATDDKTASVTAADGRTFSTTDGGLFWTRALPN